MRVAVLAALTALAVSGRAQAFVRLMSTSTPARAAFWKESCVPVTIYLNGFDRTSGMSAEQIVKSITEAAHAWSSDVVTCEAGGAPYLEIVPTLAPEDAPPPKSGYDAKNSVIFRTGDTWPYDPGALAYTNRTLAPDGHILDADIEVNASNPTRRWMNLDPGVPIPPSSGGQVSELDPDHFDLQAALTHEFGHFIGLNHTCFDPMGEMTVADDRGRNIPACDAAGPEFEAPVMFSKIFKNENVKRRLTSDDINGACAIYPASRAPAACKLDAAPAGCAVAGPGRRAPRSASSASFAFLALGGTSAFVGLARRRRRRFSDRARARS